MSIDDYNYYGDERVRARDRRSLFDSIDESRQLAQVTLIDDEGDEEIVAFPIKFVLCSVCSGKGKHVNPSIDAGGLTSEDFYEDPGFFEDYMSGQYDVDCYACNGKRVTAQIDREKAEKAALARFDEMLADMEEIDRISDAERRFGA